MEDSEHPARRDVKKKLEELWYVDVATLMDSYVVISIGESGVSYRGRAVEARRWMRVKRRREVVRTGCSDRDIVEFETGLRSPDFVGVRLAAFFGGEWSGWPASELRAVDWYFCSNVFICWMLVRMGLVGAGAFFA